jgi:hypothetical protein
MSIYYFRYIELILLTMIVASGSDSGDAAAVTGLVF